MKAILTFNLPEESEEHQTALDGWKWQSLVQELDNHLKGKLKHSNLTEEAYKELDELRGKLYNDAAGSGLSVWG